MFANETLFFKCVLKCMTYLLLFHVFLDSRRSSNDRTFPVITSLRWNQFPPDRLILFPSLKLHLKTHLFSEFLLGVL